MVGLYVVVRWVERRVWREWEARIRHCDRVNAFVSIASGVLRNVWICNYLSERVYSCVNVGRVVFLGDVGTGPNYRLVTCVTKCVSQY